MLVFHGFFLCFPIDFPKEFLGFKICSKEFLGILNLESRIQDSRFKISGDSLEQILNPGFKIQDLLQKVPGNLES